MKRRDNLQRQRSHIDRPLEPATHDPYAAAGKIAGPVACPECGAVYRRGRWRWEVAPEGAARQLCPACRRVRDGFPAGLVRLSGEFLAAHRAEVMALVRNEEAREKGTHPLQRILAIKESADPVEISTTDVHVARRIGEAVHAAFQGKLEVTYKPDEYFVSVSWTR